MKSSLCVFGLLLCAMCSPSNCATIYANTSDSARQSASVPASRVKRVRPVAPPIPVATPVITGCSPDAGLPGTSVTINGSGFGQTQGSSYVAVESTPNTFTPWPAASWSDTQIVVTVPANMPTGGVTLNVNAGGFWSTGAVRFTVGIPPRVTGSSPSYGLPGTLVNIHGSGFGASQGNGSVAVRSTVTNALTTWPVISWSNTQIVTQVPNNMPLGAVWPNVFANNLWSLSVFTFTVGTPPLLTNVSPQYGNPGTLVTLDGNSFGQSQDAGFVSFRSGTTNQLTTWPVVSWSDTQIVAQVPANMPLGLSWPNIFANNLWSVGVLNFTVGIPPAITNYSPIYGDPGTSVTIQGTNFGATQGEDSGVSAYNIETGVWTPWTVTSWSDTQIIVTVPANMPLGKIYLFVEANELYSLGWNTFVVGRPPLLSDVSPLYGIPGTLVTIDGSGFGQSQQNSYVFALGADTKTKTKWQATSWSDTKIIAQVPSDMSLGKVYVNIFANNLDSLGVVPFTVGTPPLVNTVSPQYGLPGTTLTISGSNFGQSQGNSYVSVLSAANTKTPWPVTSWSDNQIVLQVPSNAPTGGVFVNVFANGLWSLGVVRFTVGIPPLVSGVSPQYGNPGTLVTINGSAFGQSQGSGYVAVRSTVTNTLTNWPVISWSDTQIVVQVPSNMPLGAVWPNVVANGLWSLGVCTYTVGIPPLVSGVSPQQGKPGASVTITGSNFGSSQGSGYVTVRSGGTNALTTWPLISWSDTQIVAQIPNNMAAGYVWVNVVANNLWSFGVVPFTVGP